MFFAFEYMIAWCEESIPKLMRILFAVMIGMLIFTLTHHAHDVTGSGTMFAEMFHSMGDIIEIIAYSIALVTVGATGRLVARVSGGLLAIGGCLAFYKAWQNFMHVIHGEDYFTKDIMTFGLTSIAVLVLITLQVILIAHEHGDMCAEEERSHHDHNHKHPVAMRNFAGHGSHGHHSHQHIKDSHTALMKHLWSDIFQASLAVFLAIFMAIAPNSFFLLMFDIIFTCLIALWMLGNGRKILFRKYET